MELIATFPKFDATPMISLDNSDLKTNSLVNQNVAMTSTQDQDLAVAASMVKTIVNPAAYSAPATSQSVVALETLGAAYSAVNISGSAEETVSNQTALTKATALALDKVSTSVKNDALYAKTSASEVKVLNEQYQQFDTEVSSRSSYSSTINTGTSYAELWSRLATATATIKKDYVDFYATLMQKYTEMYEAFNEYCQKASSSAVSTGDDGNNVRFNTGTMSSGYNNFYNKLVGIENSLGSIKNWSLMNADERASMVATLEPAFSVDNGKIWFNLDQYNSVKGTNPSGISDGKVSTASYQAWLATFNAAGSAFQSNMQSFAQRYSQANSTFDNLNKVLSGAISSLADSAKDVLKSLG